MNDIQFNIDGLKWFDDSPDPGTPECICSDCGEMIGPEDEGAVRFFDKENKKEIRMHYACARDRTVMRTTEIVYRCKRHGAGPCRVMVDEIDKDNTVLMSEVLDHRICHSPTGLQWGYGGSGPADLALSILKNYFLRQSIPADRADKLALKYYQKYKWDVIAKVEGDLRITQTEIEGWFKGKGHKIDCNIGR